MTALLWRATKDDRRSTGSVTMGHSINNTYNFIVSGYATGTFDAPTRLVARPYFIFSTHRHATGIFDAPI